MACDFRGCLLDTVAIPSEGGIEEKESSLHLLPPEGHTEADPAHGHQGLLIEEQQVFSYMFTIDGLSDAAPRVFCLRGQDGQHAVLKCFPRQRTINMGGYMLDGLAFGDRSILRHVNFLPGAILKGYNEMTMSRKVRRVQYTLDPQGIKSLPPDEVAAILRGADDLIMRAGRSLLAKILKGSREKKVLDLGLDRSPVYGYYRHLKLAEIMTRVDRVILDGYLDLEYDGLFPLLVYTPKGWEIERETYAQELLKGFDKMLDSGREPIDVSYLKDRDRGLILLFLDLVEATKDPKYIPLLEAWADIDYKKVRKRIRQVIRGLGQATRNE